MFYTKRAIRSRRREVRLFKKRIITSFVGASLTAILAGAIFYGTRQEMVTIDTVVVRGGVTVPHRALEEKTHALLSGTYALLVPRKFSWLFPQEEIEAALNAVPRVHDATVVRSALDTLEVSFEEYVPYALWCENGSSSLCYFVDEHGYAYESAPPLLGHSLVRFITESRTPTLRTFVHEQEYLGQYEHFAESLLATYGARIASITETKDFDTFVTLDSGSEIRIHAGAKLEEVSARIASIIKSEHFKEDTLADFEYIDLRFGNKVYTRKKGALEAALLKEEEEQKLAEETTSLISSSTTTTQE